MGSAKRVVVGLESGSPWRSTRKKAREKRRDGEILGEGISVGAERVQNEISGDRKELNVGDGEVGAGHGVAAAEVHRGAAHVVRALDAAVRHVGHGHR